MSGGNNKEYSVLKRDGFQFMNIISIIRILLMFIELIRRSSLQSFSSSNNYQKDDFDEGSLQFFCDFSQSFDFSQDNNADPNKRDHKSSTQLIDPVGQPSSQRREHVEERRNRVIGMERICQLIEAFTRYDIQHDQQENKRKTTLADIARKLQIRYETVRKKHALFKKYGADFLYAQFDKKDKGKLARRLVSSSLKRGPQMKYSKDISAYIEQRYGIAYSIRTINQMRKQLKLRPTFNEQADFSSICSEELGYLLNGILSKSYDIYYTWRVVSSSNRGKNLFPHSTLFFASRSKCMIREMKVNDVISDVIKQICCQIYGGFEENNINHYCVIAYLEDICGDCNDLLTQKIKQNNFLIQMALIKAKVILLGEQKGKNDILPQWIEDCFMRQKDQEEEYLDLGSNQNEDMKEIICKGIEYFEKHLPKCKN